jgi:hypothetical protein
MSFSCYEEVPYLLGCALWEFTMYVKKPKRGSRSLLFQLDRIGWRLMNKLGDAPHLDPIRQRRYYRACQGLLDQAAPIANELRLLLCAHDVAKMDDLLACLQRVVTRELTRLTSIS